MRYLLRGGLREAFGVEILLLRDALLLLRGDVGVEAWGRRGLHVDYLGLAGLLGVRLVVLWLAAERKSELGGGRLGIGGRRDLRRGLSYELLGLLLDWLLHLLG
jgi:hypothetical protein